jgi:hypothetical protein
MLSKILIQFIFVYFLYFRPQRILWLLWKSLFEKITLFYFYWDGPFEGKKKKIEKDPIFLTCLRVYYRFNSTEEKVHKYVSIHSENFFFVDENALI